MVRIGICVVFVTVLCCLSAIMDFIVWIYPYMDSITFLDTMGVIIYEGAYILWYMEVWAYGGVDFDARKTIRIFKMQFL